MRRFQIPLLVLVFCFTAACDGQLWRGDLRITSGADGGPTDFVDGGSGSTDGQAQPVAVCGDGVIEGAETCDGTCPTACDDRNSCTTDTMAGAAGTCDATCSFTDIDTCESGDGCCPDGCDATNDNDCSATCGDGVVDENETCDANCPTQCSSSDACQLRRLTGSPANCNVQCSATEVTACTDADGCCPSGCTRDTDDDCGAVCGNDVVEGVELCDGDCPMSCDDSDACTADALTGAAATCDAACANVEITRCVGGDGCCPSSCTEVNDSDCSPVCGNDVIETGETCDGPSCPADCNDGKRCTADMMVGDASTCDVQCQNVDIVQCLDGDGCCAPGCDESNDDDCSAVCGNGVLEAGETCDPQADCPTSCDDGDACTADVLEGSDSTCDAVCLYANVSACTDGDGCCPSGCDATNDDDCTAMCGNQVVEPGETCDPQISCPSDVAACDDGDACTGDTFVGNASDCSAACVYNDVTACIDGDGCCAPGCDATSDDDCVSVCDNGTVEDNETCDPIASCPVACDDMDACTNDTLIGSPTTCTAECQFSDITACVDADGCCPAGCDATNDSDCSAVCDNGVLEGAETCDPISSCPAACDDTDACTTDTLVGNSDDCTAACEYADITICIDADGCCAPGCNANNDDDCAPMCGNDVIEGMETCDPVSSCPQNAGECDDGKACTADAFSGSAASCDAECTNTNITACVDGDGCCPTTCTYVNDDDCPVVLDCRDPNTWPQSWTDLEDAIFAETNARRVQDQSCGGTPYTAKSAFVFDERLREAARCHAIDMTTNDFFSHTGSDGSDPGQRITATGYTWTGWAENIAAGNSTAVAIVDQWMNSTGHCKNIMSGTVDELGVGYVYDVDAQYRHYSVQVFGRD